MKVVTHKEFAIRASLQTLKEQRTKICNDSLSDGFDIYMGLHKKKYERSLHFDKYIIIWLDEHWNSFCKLCDDNRDDFLEYQRYEITTSFAKRYLEMLVGVEKQQSFSQVELTSKCLKIQKQYLDELLSLAMKNQRNIEKLKLEASKHAHWFELEIEKING